MSYTTAGAIVQKNREDKKAKFKDILAKAKGDNYYYNPKTGTHKLKTNTKGAKYA